MRPDEPLDPELTSTELSTGAIFHTDTGSGPTIVAVHGMPATSRDFRWLDAAFDGRVRLLRLDLPGFGRSPHQTCRGNTFSDLGEVVAEFCEAAELDDAILLGHSLGGAVAVDAATRTRRVAGLALINSSGPIDHRGNFPRTYRVLERIADLHPIAHRATVAIAKPIAQRVGFSKRLSDDEMFFAARFAGRFDPDLLGVQLAGLDMPVFVASAEDDRSVQLEVTTRLLERAQNAEHVRYPSGGHNLQSKRATELADAIVAWRAGLV